MPGSKLYPILGVRAAQVFTVSLSWVRPKANGGRPGHVSHPLQLPPVSTQTAHFLYAPHRKRMAAACLPHAWIGEEASQRQPHPCMKQNRKDGPPGRSHRIEGRARDRVRDDTERAGTHKNGVELACGRQAAALHREILSGRVGTRKLHSSPLLRMTGTWRLQTKKMPGSLNSPQLTVHS
jgi:hypothetical protein